MSGKLELAYLKNILLNALNNGDITELSGTDTFIQNIISLFVAAVVWIGVLWVVTLAMHMIFEHRRRDEYRRLRALRKRFPTHGYRPRL